MKVVTSMKEKAATDRKMASADTSGQQDMHSSVNGRMESRTDKADTSKHLAK